MTMSEDKSTGGRRLSAAQLKEQSIRINMISNARTPEERERLLKEFREWGMQGRPVTDGFEDMACRAMEAWQTELRPVLAGLLEKCAALDPTMIPECRRMQSLDVLNVAVRVRTVICRAFNVETVWDLVHIPPHDMQRIISRYNSRGWWLMVIDAIEQALRLLAE